ncbi:hypothetical protein O6H91_16G041700 [Diphasiastrum complanatum]|uniref:Uncharacterized protein n=1 Tax=Diphasiastrum complanatum TaxID=34168 RepID=A0ACC2BBU0_DIPCM|nr:hypothetical protein O6H91_16G041700 [Diphasiastrum complanatum]
MNQIYRLCDLFERFCRDWKFEHLFSSSLKLATSRSIWKFSNEVADRVNTTGDWKWPVSVTTTPYNDQHLQPSDRKLKSDMWMVNGDVNLGADNRKLKSDTWQLNRDLNIGTDDHQLKPDTWRMNEYVNLASDDRKVKPDMWRVNGGVNLGAEDRKSKPDTWRVNGESKRSGNKKQPLLDHPKGAAEQKQNTVNNSNTSQQATNSVDKRFKSLPPAEALPRSEILGGYIFVCNNDTMQEDLKRQLFGLPQRYRDSVRAIQPGLPLFLYNYTTHQLHGIYEVSGRQSILFHSFFCHFFFIGDDYLT